MHEERVQPKNQREASCRRNVLAGYSIQKVTAPFTIIFLSTGQTLQPTLANPSALGVISGSRATLRHTLQSQLVSTLSILLSTLVLRAFS